MVDLLGFDSLAGHGNPNRDSHSTFEVSYEKVRKTMETATFNDVTLRDLPMPGETIHLDGYISKHDKGVLVLARARVANGGSIAAWAQVALHETETAVILDESYELFSVTVKCLDWEFTQENYGSLPDICKATATVVRYNTRDEHQFYYGG